MMDSTGLGVLIGTRLTIMPKSGQVALINPSSKIKTLIAASKLTAMFESYSYVADVVILLRKPFNHFDECARFLVSDIIHT